MDIDNASFLNEWTNQGNGSGSGSGSSSSSNQLSNDDFLFAFTTATESPTLQNGSGEAHEPQSLFLIIDHLSDGQVKSLSLLFVFSGLLSVLGSSTIVHKVLKNRNKATPYDRLMLGLSSCDILASITWMLTPFLLPQETSPRVWALGNDTTCTILGTFTQFAFCAVVYNCMLSMYYLLTVRYQIKRHIFAVNYEPCFHIFPIFYFMVTSVAGAALGIYSEIDLGMGCWVNDYPDGCLIDDSCTSDKIGWIFGAGPTIITFLALIINNFAIYRYVKTTLKKQQQLQSHQYQYQTQPSPIQEQQKTTNEHAHTNNTIDMSSNHKGSNNLEQPQQLQPHPQQSNSTIPITASSLSSSSAAPSSSSSLAMVSMNSSQIALDLRKERMELHRKQIEEVATQGFLYVATFILAYSPAFAIRIIEAYGSYPLKEQPIFPLFVLNAILLPLQGFFNMFVYNRPNYNRVRMACPENGILWAIQKACFDSNIPKLSEASRWSSMPQSSRMMKSGGMGGARSGASSGMSAASRRNMILARSSSGKHFSSDLDILHEDSNEEDDSSSDEESMASEMERKLSGAMPTATTNDEYEDGGNKNNATAEENNNQESTTRNIQFISNPIGKGSKNDGYFEENEIKNNTAAHYYGSNHIDVTGKRDVTSVNNQPESPMIDIDGFPSNTTPAALNTKNSSRSHGNGCCHSSTISPKKPKSLPNMRLNISSASGATDGTTSDDDGNDENDGNDSSKNNNRTSGNHGNECHEAMEHDDEEEQQQVMNRPQSVPTLGTAAKTSSLGSYSNDYGSSDEDFDLEEEYRKIFHHATNTGAVRRLGFDGSVQQHPH